MGAPTGTFRRFGLSVVLALVLVSGCSDDPVEGAKVPPRATPTTTSASPTPDTPEKQIKATMAAYFAERTLRSETGDIDASSRLQYEGLSMPRGSRKSDQTGGLQAVRYEIRRVRRSCRSACTTSRRESGLRRSWHKVPPYKRARR